VVDPVDADDVQCLPDVVEVPRASTTARRNPRRTVPNSTPRDVCA
jgi:hypothetical protein